MQKSLFDLKEVAVVTGLSIHTIRSWAHTGKIPSIKLGSRRMVKKKDLEVMVNSGVGARKTK
jgi:excisionase family DNA binding protein